MGMERLQALVPYVKEALRRTALAVTDNYLFTVVYLPGPSMLPTLNHGNIVLAEKITTRSGKVGSGDVVAIRSPEDPRKVITKRIKGVEGDVVSYLSNPKKKS